MILKKHQNVQTLHKHFTLNALTHKYERFIIIKS